MTVEVTVGYGKTVQKQASLTLMAYRVMAPFDRQFASTVFEKIGRGSASPMGPRPEADGWLYSNRLRVPAGQIILVQARATCNGKPVRDGAIFIKVRKQAPFISISANLPESSRTTGYPSTHLVFVGEGDILTVDTLKELGMSITRTFVSSYMDEEEVNECFDIRTVCPGTPAPVLETLVTKEGKKILVDVAQPARRMRIRRP